MNWEKEYLLLDTYESPQLKTLALSVIEGTLRNAPSDRRDGLIRLGDRAFKYIIGFIVLVVVEGFLKYYRKNCKAPK